METCKKDVYSDVPFSGSQKLTEHMIEINKFYESLQRFKFFQSHIKPKDLVFTVRNTSGSVLSFMAGKELTDTGMLA